jgi:hypothetical protein
MNVSYVWRRQTIVVAICLGVVLIARLYVARFLDPVGGNVSGSQPQPDQDTSAEGAAVVEVPPPLP